MLQLTQGLFPPARVENVTALETPDGMTMRVSLSSREKPDLV